MLQFSIIIPVHNSESTIQRCIKSVQDQLIQNFEIIIIDDGSVDQSVAIVEKLVVDDVRIRLIRKTNGGVASARNAGIELIKGDYVLFVDSDDHLDPRYLQTFSDLLQIYPHALIYQSFISEYENCSEPEVLPRKYYNSQEVSKALILLEKHRCLGGACNKIFNAEIIKENNLRFNEQLHYGEDKIFTLQYLQFVNQIYLSDTCYYVYNRSSKNSLSKKHHKSEGLSLFAEQEYRLFLECARRFPDEILTNVIKTRYSSFSKYVLLSMYRPGDSASAEQKKLLREKIILLDKNNIRLPEFDVEVPSLVNKIYKYGFLMNLMMLTRTKLAGIYNLIKH